METTNINDCKDLINKCNWKEALDLLKSSIKQVENIEDLSPEILFDITKFIEYDHLSNEEQSMYLLEVFRLLRNFSVSLENQNFLIKNEKFLLEVKNIFEKLIKRNENNESLLLKVLIQFLINLIVSNKKSSETVLEIFYSDILECFMKKLHRYEIIALLYNIHLQNEELGFEETVYYSEILNEFCEGKCEFAEFFSELFILRENFWNDFEKLETKNRVLVLELLQKQIIRTEFPGIPQNSLKVLSNRFANSCEIIFQTSCTHEESLEPFEVSLLLEILGSSCKDEKNLKILQNDKELIIKSGILLINIHRLGKQTENYFTSVQKLSEIKEPNELMKNHPAFGFKVGLVRLIGNLCWKNKSVQDLIRKAEIIPVLLDCCNIDARNPLIMQWVILAIRNLCEKNVENQGFIANMHKKGVVSSSLIEEMGLTLHSDGDESGGIRIVPLDLTR